MKLYALAIFEVLVFSTDSKANIVFLLDNGMPSYRLFSDELTFYHSSNT